MAGVFSSVIPSHRLLVHLHLHHLHSVSSMLSILSRWLRTTLLLLLLLGGPLLLRLPQLGSYLQHRCLGFRARSRLKKNGLSSESSERAASYSCRTCPVRSAVGLHLWLASVHSRFQANGLLVNAAGALDRKRSGEGMRLGLLLKRRDTLISSFRRRTSNAAAQGRR
jgi:hypothetical protein